MVPDLGLMRVSRFPSATVPGTDSGSRAQTLGSSSYRSLLPLSPELTEMRALVFYLVDRFSAWRKGFDLQGSFPAWLRWRAGPGWIPLNFGVSQPDRRSATQIPRCFGPSRPIPMRKSVRRSKRAAQSVKSGGRDLDRPIRIQEISSLSGPSPKDEQSGRVRQLRSTSDFLKSESSSWIPAPRIQGFTALAFRPSWLTVFSALCFKSENKSKAWW